jgi:hypothetical protein
MHNTLTQTRKTSSVKSQKDRALPYLLATSASPEVVTDRVLVLNQLVQVNCHSLRRPEVGTDRVIVLNQGPKSWASPTTALAMVVIALATLVGGAMTTWHYWNVEKRAAQGEYQAAMQRQMEWWKGEIQRAESKRQLFKELEEARVKPAPYAYGATVRTAAATERDMLSGPSPAAFSVP